jgi:hypothetical protein
LRRRESEFSVPEGHGSTWNGVLEARHPSDSLKSKEAQIIRLVELPDDAAGAPGPKIVTLRRAGSVEEPREWLEVGQPMRGS